MTRDIYVEIIIAALVIDFLFGEPPANLHPVVWMGKLIDMFARLAPSHNRRLFGCIMAFVFIGTSAAAGYLIEHTVFNAYLAYPVSYLHLLTIIALGFLFKTTFSIRMFISSAFKIKKHLESGEIGRARDGLKTFVGRDTSSLDQAHASSAVVESLAENFVDGILSPFFYFLLAGLPGAFAFKMISTLDSMVGYKKEPFLDLGFASARIDDAANFIPARLSLPLITLATIPVGDPKSAVRICLRDRKNTPSPNSGIPMSAMAGALRVKLEKIGYYVLGSSFADPGPEDIRKAAIIIVIASVITAFITEILYVL